MIAPDLIPGANVVNKMARETGGEVFQADDGKSIKTAMNAVINRLKKRYTLGYSSSNPNADGKFREIAVKLKNTSPGATQNYRVFARRGYYAPLARTATAAKTP
jgi:VWFA-related protein